MVDFWILNQTRPTRCSRTDLIPRCVADEMCLAAWMALVQNCPRASTITSISQSPVVFSRFVL